MMHVTVRKKYLSLESYNRKGAKAFLLRCPLEMEFVG